MLGPLSPPLAPYIPQHHGDPLPDEPSPLDLQSNYSKSDEEGDSATLVEFGYPPVSQTRAASGARTWSKLYQDCIIDPYSDLLNSMGSGRSRHSLYHHPSRSASHIGPLDRIDVRKSAKDEAEAESGEPVNVKKVLTPPPSTPVFEFTVSMEDAEAEV